MERDQYALFYDFSLQGYREKDNCKLRNVGFIHRFGLRSFTLEV